MQHIAAEQIRGARGMLGWTREDLAIACGLAPNTIRNMEDGKISPRDDTARVICRAFEKEGLEFIPGGIRKHKNEAQLFEGPESRKAIYDDILRTIIADQCNELIAVAGSPDMFANIFCKRADWLGRLNEFTRVRCLVAEDMGPLPDLPQIQFRELETKQALLPECFIYGHRYVIVHPTGVDNYRFLMCSVPSMAQYFRSQFNLLWKRADDASKFEKMKKRPARI